MQRTTKAKGMQQFQSFTIKWKQCKPMKQVCDFIETSRLKYYKDDNEFLLSSWPGRRVPAKQVTAVILRVRELLQLPSIPNNQSHMLRRGAAIAMNACGVPLQRILSWGVWKDYNSLKPYIERREWSVRTSSQDQCFGWMKLGVEANADSDMGQKASKPSIKRSNANKRGAQL